MAPLAVRSLGRQNGGAIDENMNISMDKAITEMQIGIWCVKVVLRLQIGISCLDVTSSQRHRRSVSPRLRHRRSLS